MTAAAGTEASSGGRLAWVGIALAAVAVVAIVVLTGLGPSGQPFDPRSAAPDGYKALSILLEERGAEVGHRSAAAVATDPLGPGDVVVVPAPGLASSDELRALDDAVDVGAVVVLGEPATLSVTPDGETGGTLFLEDPRTLADTPADPQGPGDCGIAVLDGLGDIDAAFASSLPSGGGDSCYGDRAGALVVQEDRGAGRTITLGSPYLLVNARLQPDKEHGGEPLDNAALALRLFGPTPDGAGPGVRVTFVDAVASSGVNPNGGRNPLTLLPLPVQLALVQLIAAFCLYAWWRSRRLGPPVHERLPVDIAGSELVAAVGDLLRRRGSPDRAAAILRADVRRSLGQRLGVPPDAAPASLVAVIADRTGLDSVQVAAALLDGPVGSAEALVRLAHTLDAIRQEVLHGHPVA